MTTAFLFIGSLLIGLVLSITPIPYLPKIYWEGFNEFKETHDSIGVLLLYGLLNLPWALIPVVLIGGVFSTSGLFPSIVFAAGMYGGLILSLCSSRSDESSSSS